MFFSGLLILKREGRRGGSEGGSRETSEEERRKQTRCRIHGTNHPSVSPPIIKLNNVSKTPQFHSPTHPPWNPERTPPLLIHLSNSTNPPLPTSFSRGGGDVPPKSQPPTLPISSQSHKYFLLKIRKKRLLYF